MKPAPFCPQPLPASGYGQLHAQTELIRQTLEMHLHCMGLQAGKLPEVRRTVAESNPPELPFDAFISYSRHDMEFARTLERALESYQPPSDLPVPQRRLRVFRDETDFTGVKYFEAVDKHLGEAARLLVLCSPAARKSSYVNDEIQRFARHKSAAAIIPILIDGLPNNETAQAEKNQEAFPDALVELLEMPRAIEYLRFDNKKDKLDRDAFSGSWFSVLAEIYGLSREVVEQREKKRRIRRRRTVVSIVTGVITALSAALVFALISRSTAVRERNTALARQLAAEAQVLTAREPYLLERAALLGAESLHRLPTPEGEQVVREAIGLLPRVAADFPYAANVTTAALSPDGAYAAVAGDKGVDLFDSTHHQKVLHVAGESVVFATAFSPDGKWLVTGQMDGTVAVFETPSGRPKATFHADGQVTNLAFSPDGEYLAARSTAPTVNVWSLRDSREAGRLSHEGVVQSIAFSLDGRRLCTGTKNNLVYLWDWPSGKFLRQLKAAGTVWGLACGASGEVVAGVGAREVQVWGSTAAETGVLPHQFPVRMVAFSRDGQYLATAGENFAQVWKREGWSPVARLEHQDNVEAILFHPRRPLLVTASDDRTARIWDIATGSELARVAHQEAVVDVNFDGDGGRMITTSNDHSARVVNVPAERAFPWEAGKPTAADFDTRGERVATGDFYGSVRLWNVPSRQAISTAAIFPGQEITAIRFSPDERYLAVGTRRGAAAVMELSSWTVVSRFDHGAKAKGLERVKSIAMDAASHLIFTGGDDGKVKVWSLEGRPIATLQQPDPVTGLALNSDGSRLAVTSGSFGSHERGAFVVWNTATRTELRRVVNRPTSLEAVAFSPDSRIIATANQDSSAQLWNAASGLELQNFTVDQPVWAVAFSADGRYLATGSKDGAARVWERSTGRELIRLPHTGSVRMARFTSDGKRVLTASFDPSGVMTQAREWEWQPDDLIRQVCSRVARSLTPDDWNRYVVIEPYHPVCQVSTQ
jgi:WD40 repeat protein